MDNFSTLYSLIKKEDEAFNKVKSAESLAGVFRKEAERAKTDEDKNYFLGIANKYSSEADWGNIELRAARQELFAYFDTLKSQFTK